MNESIFKMITAYTRTNDVQRPSRILVNETSYYFPVLVRIDASL